jgi:hypothetical protein
MPFACLSDYYKGAYVVKASFILSAKIPPHPLSPANSAGFYRSPNRRLKGLWRQIPACFASF